MTTHRASRQRSNKKAPAVRPILVVGSANMDLVASVERYALPGETIFGRGFGMFPGGKGANQAVCCAKLGAPVRFIGKMGCDIFGDRLARGMERDGVKLQGLLRDRRKPTGTALIVVDEKGQNEIVVISGANMALSPKDLRRHAKLFEGAGIVLLQLEIPLETVEAALKEARRRGAMTILNPAPGRRLPDSILKMVDFITPNETELEALTGKSARTLDEAAESALHLIEQGVGRVIVTMGECGCLLVTKDIIQHVEARAVKAVDTTAAGDAFNGGLAFGLSRGWELASSLAFASDVAACCVTKPGAQASLPTRAALRRFQSQSFIRTSDKGRS